MATRRSPAFSTMAAWAVAWFLICGVWGGETPGTKPPSTGWMLQGTGGASSPASTGGWVASLDESGGPDPASVPPLSNARPSGLVASTGGVPESAAPPPVSPPRFAQAATPIIAQTIADTRLTPMRLIPLSLHDVGGEPHPGRPHPRRPTLAPKACLPAVAT